MIRESLAGQNILVTGGAGFIGSHLVDRLLDGGARQVVAMDNLFLGSEANLKPAMVRGALFYREDAEFESSLRFILEQHKITTVFNCATRALNYSFINPKKAFDTNTTITLNLLELQRQNLFRTLCHFSSSEVYGSAIYEPIDEGHPRNPTTTYAAGKAAADLAVESYVRMFGLDAYIVRPFNNYGPRQNRSGPLAGVIPATVMRILSGESPVIHGTGKQTRDFIHVRDTVAAVLALHEKLSPGESVNIAANQVIEIGQLIRAISKIMKYSGPILMAAARPSDVQTHNASTAKLKSLVNSPATPIEEGLKETITWLLAESQGTGSQT